MDIELRHLKLIATVARTGSLSRAGQSLNLSQSALSHQLRDVEERLQVSLFNRVSRKMVLTPAGEILLQSANAIMQELSGAHRQLDTMARGESGTIRISTECYTCYHWLPEIVRRFRVEFPQVEFEINVDATRRPLDALRAGKLDVAIVHEPFRTEGLAHRPLFRDEQVVIVVPDHPWSKRRYIELKDLITERLYLYNVPEEDSFLFQNVFIPAGVYPQNVSRVELTEAIIEFVKAGLGVGILAKWAVWPHIQEGKLKAIGLTKAGIHRQWGAATMPQHKVLPYLEAFLNLVVNFSRPALRTGNLKCPAN